MTAAHERAVRWLQHLCRGLLRAYPAEFRQEYGGEMVRSLRDECRAAAHRRGWAGLLGVGANLVGDVFLAAPGVQLDVLGQDLRHAWRMLRANPGFALAATMTLALAIGGNSALFGLVRGILLAPLPFPDPEQLVMIWEKNPKGIERNSISPPNFLDYRKSSSAFSAMAAFYEESVNLTGVGTEPEHVLSAVVTSGFFELLGVRPVVGSGLQGERSVVVSYGLWQRRFGGAADLLGQTLRIDDEVYTIRGVTPADFRFPTHDVALWTVMPERNFLMSRQARFLSAVGRLKTGAGLASARAEMEGLAASLAGQFPASNKGWSVTLVPLKEQMVGSIRKPLLILMGAVGFILLIACANVANLLLARSARRQGEMAIRTALGASSARIGRQILTESVLIAGLGAAAGLLLCWGSLAVLKVVRPPAIPRVEEVGVNGWVVGFAVAAALLAGFVSGLIPLLRIWRSDLRQVMQEGMRNRGSAAGDWLRRSLVGGEIAVCMVLLVGSGLLIRSFVQLQQLDPGFDARQATSFRIDLPTSRYQDGPSRAALLAGALNRVRTLPGVISAGMISSLPLTGGEGHNRFGFVLERGGEPAGGEDHRFYARWITPGYLAAMAIPLRQGRGFTERDSLGTTPVVIIDQELARRYFPNGNPIGRQLRLSYDKGRLREIVGVAGAVRLVGLEKEPAPQIYIPVLQEPRLSSISLVVRSAVDPAALVRTVRDELRAVDSQLPVYDIRTLGQYVAESIAPRRLTMLLMSLLAGIALLLAGVGVYGVMSYMVQEREQEVGIRMALGARPAEVLRMVVAQGMGQAGVGIAAGLAMSLLLSKLIAGLLFGVQPVDGWTFAAVSGLTALVACAASAVPGWRAARVDPARALHGG
jgi:putative ABC transport system permease protein